MIRIVLYSDDPILANRMRMLVQNDPTRIRAGWARFLGISRLRSLARTSMITGVSWVS